MTTLEHPVFAVSGTLEFRLLSGRRIRAAVFTAAPGFRMCRAKVTVQALPALKHGPLSAVFGAWRAARRSSSWSRA